jgi:hypothetical protein
MRVAGETPVPVCPDPTSWLVISQDTRASSNIDIGK